MIQSYAFDCTSTTMNHSIFPLFHPCYIMLLLSFLIRGNMFPLLLLLLLLLTALSLSVRPTAFLRSHYVLMMAVALWRPAAAHHTGEAKCAVAMWTGGHTQKCCLLLGYAREERSECSKRKC